MSDRIIADRYSILEQIGHGGMGVIFRAEDQKTGKIVALKTLLPQFIGNSQYVARFRNESRVACGVSHPNLCQGFEKGVHNQIPFYTMEFLDGKSIDQHILSGHIFSPSEAISVLAQAAAGLAALTTGTRIVAHRDLSAGNVFITKEGAIKLADFGIAKLEEGEDTGTGAFLGNVHYMSPEQIRDPRNVDVRSDIYTLGIVFYEMITGIKPFDGSKPDIANKHLHHQYVPFALEGPDGDFCNDVLSRCLAKDRNERYQNPAQMINHLSQREGVDKPVIPTISLKRRLTAPAAAVAVVGAVILILTQLGQGMGSPTTTTIQPSDPSDLKLNIVITEDASATQSDGPGTVTTNSPNIGGGGGGGVNIPSVPQAQH